MIASDDPAISDILEWMRTLEHVKRAHGADISGLAEWANPIAEADALVAKHCTRACSEGGGASPD